jgi:hypothetical protein
LGRGKFGVVISPHLLMYGSTNVNTGVYGTIYIYINIWTGIERNGITRGMRKLEWHISKFGFCNGISLNGESCNGINPINPFY